MDEHLCVGMYVRIPIDSDSAHSLAECRDFRIGQILDVNESGCTVRLVPGANDPFRQNQIELPLVFIRRCCLRDGTAFTHKPHSTYGTLLTPCKDSWDDGTPLAYFALLKGSVCRVSEVDIWIEAYTQAPDPAEQIAAYEFHPFIWKAKRDQLLQSYIQLQSATFGMEELVGSRILLLPHQAETAARVLGDRYCRYVLADEVGLGKTIEACVVLKGLRRRNPNLKTLIITPHTLTRQWFSELSRKFWLDFSLATDQNHFKYSSSAPGIILSIEDLQQHPVAMEGLLKRHWDLLIIDEAHRLHRKPTQYAIAHHLSSVIDHCLVLSATPILRRADEYLSLLRLMHPQQYDAMSAEQFEAMLSIQSDLRRRLAYVGHALNESDFDAGEFHEEIAPLVESLSQDRVLPALLKAVDRSARDGGLGAARELHSYLSENYRIENHVIRNRRASLEGQVALPARRLDDSYRYVPGREEGEVLAELAEYARAAVSHDREMVEITRVLHYAAASSPFALQVLIHARQAWLVSHEQPTGIQHSLAQLLTTQRAYPGEEQRLEQLRWRIDQWIQTTQSSRWKCK